MESFSQLLDGRLVVGNAVATAVFIVAVLLLRGAGLRFVRRATWASDQVKLRWNVQVRWVSLLVLALGIVVVWASELRTVALSMVALAVAIVLATKELILCVSGSVLRTASGCYTVGDRIKVGDVRGDVVGLGALTTTVLEVGAGHRRTGRAIVMPNSLLLNTPVTNETFTNDFVLHVISIPLSADNDWQVAEKRLLEAANEVCAPFLEEARRYINDTARHYGLSSISVEPSVSLQVADIGKLNLVLRVPSRARSRGKLEQNILRRFFNERADHVLATGSVAANVSDLR